MRINKIVKSSVLICLIIVILTAVGCGSEVYKDPGPRLQNQLKNIRYYFQQGYREDWDANFDPGERALDDRYQLLFEMWPAEARGDALYSIYTGDTELLLTTVLETTDKMMDPEQDLYFNKRFIRDEKERENFKFTSDKSMATYNKLQYQHVSYSFTQDGADWVGDFYVTMKGSKYYVIVWERKAEIKDKYHDQFIESISDYRFVGFEDEN